MPLPVISSLPQGQIVLHFETNNTIEIGQLCAVFTEIANLAKSYPNIGPNSKIILLRLESGSPTTTWIDVVNAVGAAAGVGSFGIGLANLIQEQKSRKLPRRIAELIIDNDITELDLVFREPGGDELRHVRMLRNSIPAVQDLEARRSSGNSTTGPWDPSVRRLNESAGVQDSSNPHKRIQNGKIQLSGRIVTTDGGRFAEFRTKDQVFKLIPPDDLMDFAPIGEVIDIKGQVTDAETGEPALEISTWEFQSDRNIDWENRKGLPGIQVEKLRSLERRDGWRRTKTPPNLPELEGEEARMRDELYSLDDSFLSSENTENFVGRFAYDGLDRIFRTRTGNEYRIFSSKDRDLGRDFVVRAHKLINHIGQRDWLHIVDVFDITD